MSLKLYSCLSYKSSRLKVNSNLLDCSESVWLILRKMIWSKESEENLWNKPFQEQLQLRMTILVTFSLIRR